MKKGILCALLCQIIILAVPAGAQTRGVSKTEIIVGTIQDISGPVAALGVHFRNGSQMRFDEFNQAGGAYGRKIRLVVEDSGYDPKKGVLAAQKLIERDKVFAVINNLGTPIAMVTMPTFIDNGVLHLFPTAQIPVAYEPVHKLKFAMHPPYLTTTPLGVKYLVRTEGFKKVGILYQDDDFGQEVSKGAEVALSDLGLPLCQKVSYKRGATEFSSQMAKLKGAGCDLIVLGTSVRETIGAYSESRKIGWNVAMMVTQAAYTAQIHQIGGQVMEGLYGLALLPHPYPEGANKLLADWIERYKKQFGSEPNTWSVGAYIGADIFVRALEKAGPNLSADGVSSAMETISTPTNYFGAPSYSFTKTDHLGNRLVRMTQIRNGRWENLTDYLK